MKEYIGKRTLDELKKKLHAEREEEKKMYENHKSKSIFKDTFRIRKSYPSINDV